MAWGFSVWPASLKKKKTTKYNQVSFWIIAVMLTGNGTVCGSLSILYLNHYSSLVKGLATCWANGIVAHSWWSRQHFSIWCRHMWQALGKGGTSLKIWKMSYWHAGQNTLDTYPYSRINWLCGRGDVFFLNECLSLNGALAYLEWLLVLQTLHQRPKLLLR